MPSTLRRPGTPPGRPIAITALLLAVLLVVGAGAVGVLVTGGNPTSRASAVEPSAATPGTGAASSAVTDDPSASETSAPPAPSGRATAGRRDGDDADQPTDGGDGTTPSTTPRPTESAEAEVQQPGKPGTGKTVTIAEVPTEPPVDLEDSTQLGAALAVELSSIEAVQAEAKAPGEVSGPGLRVSLRVENTSRRPVDLASVIVFVSYGADRVPASQFGTSSEPLTGSLAPGASLTGRYVYLVPAEGRGDLRVEVSQPGAPTAVFTGSVGG